MLGVTAAATRFVCENCAGHMGRGWWWAMGIGWLVFLGLIVVLAVVLARHYRPTGGARRTAHDTLDERFARGEIDEDEYRSRRDALRS
jgi:putative membrane protein